MPTKKQKQQAEQQKQQKLQLEAALAVALLSLINKMSRSARSFYANEKQIFDLNVFFPQLSASLLKYYRRTYKQFSKDQITDVSQQIGATLTTDETNQLLGFLDSSAVSKSKAQTAILLKTMQDQLNQEFLTAESQLTDSSAIAKQATNAWKSKTSSRVNPTIVNTEIQSTAEDTKDTTTTYMVGALSAQTAVRAAYKTWITVGDDKVRPWHAEANGERVLINDKYTVGGQQLKYPGDPSGSPDNIINCRCASLTLIS